MGGARYKNTKSMTINTATQLKSHVKIFNKIMITEEADRNKYNKYILETTMFL